MSYPALLLKAIPGKKAISQCRTSRQKFKKFFNKAELTHI